MGPAAKEYPKQYFLASALAATVNYPLWRSAAIGQSGFRVAATVGGVTVPANLAPYVHGFLPPYKGMAATVFGMTWARAAIFWASDAGREVMLQQGYSEAAATVAPPLVTSTLVQVINQPIVRSTVTLQDPKYDLPNVWRSMQQLYATHGVAGLWHGTTAGVLKTVPKYGAWEDSRRPSAAVEICPYDTLLIPLTANANSDCFCFSGIPTRSRGHCRQGLGRGKVHIDVERPSRAVLSLGTHAEIPCQIRLCGRLGRRPDQSPRRDSQ